MHFPELNLETMSSFRHVSDSKIMPKENFVVKKISATASVSYGIREYIRSNMRKNAVKESEKSKIRSEPLAKDNVTRRQFCNHVVVTLNDRKTPSLHFPFSSLRLAGDFTRNQTHVVSDPESPCDLLRFRRGRVT